MAADRGLLLRRTRKVSFRLHVLVLLLCWQQSTASGRAIAQSKAVCKYSALAVLGLQANALSKLAGCSFAVADDVFYDVVDTSAAPRTVAERDYAFAHEAPVWLPGLKQIFFVSNRLGDTSGAKQFIELQLLDPASGKVTKLPSSLTDRLPMANGATIWPGSGDTIALLTQGQEGVLPGAVNKVNLSSMTSEVVLDSYFGRRFNSPNDIAFFKDGKTLFFTDPPYGFAQKFKPRPELGNFLYSFEVSPGAQIPAVAAEGFVKPNGVAFSPDFKTAYVTDTGMASGTSEPLDPAKPQAVYAFDVVLTAPPANGRGSQIPTLRNRRTFAVAASGLPDGIKSDAAGNIYVGTGSGVEVFGPSGRRLGTVLIEGGVANLVLAGKTLYALAEKRIVAVPLKVPAAKLP